ncbi:MAG: 4Fe-4S binding protein [Clostridia bacterium]
MRRRMIYMKQKSVSYFYLFTIIFFALGFFNIIFAWLGFACIVLPFILLLKDKRKTWCPRYCPRASLYNALFRGRTLTGRAGPDWLIKGRAKWFLLSYFTFNFFVMFMSTFMVHIGRIAPVEKVRFLIAFELPWDMPQFLKSAFFPDWAVHLSFRIYSMMFTTIVLGLLLDWIFLPRTWCAVCPINTISEIVLKKLKNKNS